MNELFSITESKEDKSRICRLSSLYAKAKVRVRVRVRVIKR